MSVASSNINKSFAVSTVMPVPSVNWLGSTVRVDVKAPLVAVAPPDKPEVAEVVIVTAVMSPSPIKLVQAEPS